LSIINSRFSQNYFRQSLTLPWLILPPGYAIIIS